MTKETFEVAKQLFEKISLYKDKLSRISNMIDDCNLSFYSDDTVNVQIYNGKGTSHSGYINKTIVKNMLVGAKDYYESLVEQCESEIEGL